jgi:sec-independent protein translocase protein TatC
MPPKDQPQRDKAAEQATGSAQRLAEGRRPEASLRQGSVQATGSAQRLAEGKMTIIEHLEELRSRLIKSVIALVITTLFSFIFTRRVLQILIAPAGDIKPIFLRPTEMFITYMKVALLSGVAIAMPVLVYQFLCFVLPALMPHEKRYLTIIIPGATLSFLLGLVFAYFAMLPFALRYLLTFGGDLVEAKLAISEYITFVTTLLFWVGLIFETPLLIFFLAKIGVITPQMLSRNRKFAILAIAVIAAVITPTPDPFNMMVVMVPLIVLYEIGVLLAKLA